MLSVKQGSIKYHFLSLWAIGEHSNHYAKVQYNNNNNNNDNNNNNKESEKRDKYNLKLARKLRKSWNMRVTMKAIIIETEHKGFERGQEKLEIGGWIKTIQTATMLWSTRILRRVLKI